MTELAVKKKPELRELPVEQLSPGRFQPRTCFEQEAIDELADSIRSAGIIQPIVVRQRAEQRFEIVAGERRWRAAQLAGLARVPCLVNTYSDEQMAATATIENTNRVDLNPIEEAKAYQRLIDEFDYLHEEVAAVIGKSRAKISNTLRLLKLEQQVQQWITEGALSEGHGKVLAGLALEHQAAVAEKCIRHAWSVRKTEQEIRKAERQGRSIRHGDPNVASLEDTIARQLGTEVKVEQDLSEQSGWLKIKFFDPDTLAGVLDKIGVGYK